MSQEKNSISDPAQCRENIEEKILALAEGGIGDPVVIDELYMHMVNCDSCRILFEDYFILDAGSAADDGCSVPHIGIIASGEALSLSSDKYIKQTESAQVMNTSESGILELSVPAGKTDIDFRVMEKSGGIAIEVDGLKSDDKAYLISSSDRRYALPRDGTALIENIEKGRYILSINFRSFIVVEVL